MVSEISVTYAEIVSDFSDQKRMQAQGMKLLSKTSIKIDGYNAILLHVEQSAYGKLFKKWLVAVDRNGDSTLIVATYLEAEAEQQGESLKLAVLSATFGKQTDPADALVFTVKPMAPFQVAKVMGQVMILSPEAQFPVKDENVPFMVLGLSASDNLVVSNQKAYAEHRISKTATVTKITVNQSTPVKIGDLSGYTTTAKGEGEDTGTPLSIYQVLLFDTSGYCVIQGVTPMANESTYMPIFENIAKTFKMKESHNK